MKKPDIWTDRIVRFTPFPRESDERWEAFFDLLSDHYWRGFVHEHVFSLGISSCNRVVSVSCWPWWIPKFLAVRSVAKLAARAGLGGHAEYAIERVVLT